MSGSQLSTMAIRSFTKIARKHEGSKDLLVNTLARDQIKSINELIEEEGRGIQCSFSHVIYKLYVYACK